MSERFASSLTEMYDRLSGIVRRVRALVPFDSGGLIRYDPATGTLIPQIYLPDDLPPPDPVAVETGLIGYVAARRTAEIVDDMRADLRCTVIDPASRSQLVVPVLLGDDLLGVLNVESHLLDAYTVSHREALQLLADQMALALHAVGHCATLLDEQCVHRHETETLRRLAAITSSTLNLDEMLTDALRETASLLDCDGAQLLMPEYVTYELVVHTPSLYGLAAAWPPEIWPLDGPGYLVDVYHTGTPYTGHEPASDAWTGYRNGLACPLNTRSRTLGVLHLVNRRSGPFTEVQIEIVQAVATQIATSMSSAQTFAAERRRTEMLSRINRVSQALYATLDTSVLLRSTAQSIHDVFGHEAVYILLLDEDNDQLVRVRASAARVASLQLPTDFSFPISQGIAGRAIRTGETQLVSDVRDDPDFIVSTDHHNLQSCLIVPLRRGDDTVGAIQILSAQLNAFGDLERDALETLATQVSIALENARHYDQAQRRLMEQSIVHQIGQNLTSILDYTELAHAVVEHMNRALNTSNCLVGLFEPQHNALRVEADYRAPHHRNDTAMLMTGELLSLDTHYAMTEAIHTRHPVTVYRDDLHAAPEARALLERLGDHSQLILPMIAGDRVLGVVDWTDQQPGRTFSPDDIRLAQTLVTQAAIAIDNALLFRELENRAVELAEANRLKSQFLATISHELRTPMNSIIGFSDTLLDNLYGALNPQQASRIERIQRNGYNLLMLIDDLLDLSKIDAGRMELFPASVSVRDTIVSVVQSMESQASERGLLIAVEVSDALPPVYADPKRFQQIVTNLLSNAIKFTHEGEIRVRSRVYERNDRVYIRTTVADTGIGISRANQAIIFDEFRQVDSSSTRAYSGTGLGLAITKKLVELMDGEIWVESELGKGSEFTFVLPVANAELF
jgi:signal transduction histidine kinase